MNGGGWKPNLFWVNVTESLNCSQIWKQPDNYNKEDRGKKQRSWSQESIQETPLDIKVLSKILPAGDFPDTDTIDLIPVDQYQDCVESKGQHVAQH